MCTMLYGIKNRREMPKTRFSADERDIHTLYILHIYVYYTI